MKYVFINILFIFGVALAAHAQTSERKEPIEADPQNLICGLDAQILFKALVGDLNLLTSIPPQQVDAKILTWEIYAMDESGNNRTTMTFVFEASETAGGPCKRISHSVVTAEQ